MVAVIKMMSAGFSLALSMPALIQLASLFFVSVFLIRNSQEKLVLGGFFLVISIFLNALFLMFYDVIDVYAAFYCSIFSYIISGFFFILGLVFFYDWVQWLRFFSFEKSVLKDVDAGNKIISKRVVGFICLFLLVFAFLVNGSFFHFLNPHQYAFLASYEALVHGNYINSYLWLLAYSTGTHIVSVLFCLISPILIKGKFINYSVTRIICSALFLALSISILILVNRLV